MNAYVERTLVYQTDTGSPQQIAEAELDALGRNLIVLAEPGMGKTELLRQIGGLAGHVFRSAASFVSHPQPATLIAAGQTVVIDGLDELAAANESDPVYRVLRQLIQAGCPRFVLSCRAADWRGAVARQDIADEYGEQPIEVSLEPFSAADAIRFLSSSLGAARAEQIVDDLRDKGMAELFGNPLTLKLFGEIAAEHGPLPETRGALMDAATAIMWNERNDRHASSQLAALDRAAALSAAGAICAAFVLTGAEAISLKPSGWNSPNVLRIAEIEALPGGEGATAIIRSRLFLRVPEAEDQFKPIHRTVAEYLGAHWLAARATDSLARSRVLAMLTVSGGVPASLRGIHAWLARNPLFAADVIQNDPYGVLRYGDPDTLSVTEARTLLQALKGLQQRDPYFRAEDWGRHSAKGLGNIALLDDARTVLRDPATTYHLRTLFLASIKGSPLAAALVSDLHNIILQTDARYQEGERHEAARALIAINAGDSDWVGLITSLVATDETDSFRLALEIMCDLSFEGMDADLVARAVLAYLGLLENPNADEIEHDTTGTLYTVAAGLPEALIRPVLDAFGIYLAGKDADTAHREQPEFADFIARLVVRQLDIVPPSPLTLLKWLRLTSVRHGYSREAREAVGAYLDQAPEVRRAIHRHVVFVETDHENAWGRIWRLSEVHSALSLNGGDVIDLLHAMADAQRHDAKSEEDWRDLAGFARHLESHREAILAAARRYADGRPALEQFLADLVKPLPVPEWQLRQQRLIAESAERKAAAFAERCRHFADNVKSVEAGELGWIFPIANAYLGLFSDIDKALPPTDRMAHFLTPDLVASGLRGFEATLHRADLPTPEQVADGIAASTRWNYMRPVLAGMLERVASGLTLDDLPINLVISLKLALANEHFGDRIDQASLTNALDAVLRREEGLFERYVRLLIEPSLRQKCEHIMGLYVLARSVPDRPLMARLAAEWLSRFHDLPVHVESELVDLLADTHAYDALRGLAAEHRKVDIANLERRRLWDAVALFTDFEAVREQFEPIQPADRELLWHLRHRLGGGRFEERPTSPASAALLAWVIAQFRELWPLTERPSGVTSGESNAWDASEFFQTLANRLASETSGEALAAMEALIAGPDDRYTPMLRHAADQQRRKHRELAFSGIDLERLRNVVATCTPASSDDLLAVLRFTLHRVQGMLRGNDTDSIRKYWRDDGNPRSEDECTDALTEDLERFWPVAGIQRVPQADMPAGKKADLLYTVGAAALPVEAKGQWNPALWTAADRQLDGLYIRDWRVEDRGLYLVYWFGPDVPSKFRLKSPPGGAPRPLTPAALRQALTSAIPPERRDAIAVEVLDLTR